MFNIFGSKKKEVKKEVKPVNLEDTSMRLGNNMNDVKLKMEVINKELKTQLELMRTARTPYQKQQAKQKATNLLKKKKMYEGHLNTLSNTQMTVDSANIETQIMRDNIGIIQVMKDTVDVQKGLMKDMNADSIYDVIDDMEEIKDDQAEISEAFNRNYDVEVGDEELDAELDELDYQMKVELDGKELTAPNKRVLSQKEKDEKELESMVSK